MPGSTRGNARRQRPRTAPDVSLSPVERGYAAAANGRSRGGAGRGRLAAAAAAAAAGGSEADAGASNGPPVEVRTTATAAPVALARTIGRGEDIRNGRGTRRLFILIRCISVYKYIIVFRFHEKMDGCASRDTFARSHDREMFSRRSLERRQRLMLHALWYGHIDLGGERYYTDCKEGESAVQPQ